MRTEDPLTTELDALRRERGMDSEGKTRKALAAVVRWVRKDGHGAATISAIDHRLSSKVRFDTVIDVEGNAK
jgi:hypothetical protein